MSIEKNEKLRNENQSWIHALDGGFENGVAGKYGRKK